MALDLNNTPGMVPPPGQVSNFDHPWSIHPMMYGFNITILIMMTSTTLARSYTRFVASNSRGWDDYLIIVSSIIMTCYFSIGFLIVHYGAGVHQWDVRMSSVEQLAYWLLLEEILYNLIMMFLKPSLCLQILRIFIPHKDREYWMVVAFMISQIMWFFAGIWMALFQCRPIRKTWDFQHSGSCVPWYQKFVIWQGVVNAICDVLMLVFPMVCVSRLQLATKKKLGVTAVFLVASLAVIASICRIVFSIRNAGNPDQTFSLVVVGQAISSELAAGILAGNAVTMPGFYKAMNNKLSLARNDSTATLIRRESAATDQPSGGKYQVSRTVANVEDSQLTLNEI